MPKKNASHNFKDSLLQAHLAGNKRIDNEKSIADSNSIHIKVSGASVASSCSPSGHQEANARGECFAPSSISNSCVADTRILKLHEFFFS